MTSVGNVVPTESVDANNLVNPEGISPDALLEYCNMQLQGLNGQMDTMMNQQETQLHQQEAVQQVQTTLEQFGSNGPQNAQDMQTCVNAFQTAIQSLPPGDPIAAQLQSQCNTMESTYGFGSPKTLTPSQQDELKQAQSIVDQGIPDPVKDPAGNEQYQLAQSQVKSLTATQSGGTLTNPPANNAWQGTTDALGNLASDVKSNSEIQMLQLQDLVSQRQDVTEMTTQMMTTEDNTLLDQAKAIGA